MCIVIHLSFKKRKLASIGESFTTRRPKGIYVYKTQHYRQPHSTDTEYRLEFVIVSADANRHVSSQLFHIAAGTLTMKHELIDKSRASQQRPRDWRRVGR